VSTGVLLEDIDEAATSFEITPAGTGDEEYPEEGVVRIGRELMTFTRVGDEFTITRGHRGTEADDHDEGDTVQLCYVVEERRVDAILYDLLTEYGDVPTSMIPYSDWQAEAAIWLTQHRLSTIVSEPTGVQRLVNELVEQCLFYLWWDDRAAQLEFKPIQPARGTLTEITDDHHIISGTVRIQDAPESRISQLHIYYDQANPVERLDAKPNYSRVHVRIDPDSEGADQYGERRIREIFSRWFTAANSGPVNQLGARLLIRYRNNPRQIAFSLDVKDDELWTGDVLRFTSRWDQGADGAPQSSRIQVVRAGERGPGVVQYEATDDFFTQVERYAYIAPDDAPDYLAATDEQRDRYAWLAGADNKMSNGDDPYNFS
jgi:hypothetical protein